MGETFLETWQHYVFKTNISPQGHDALTLSCSALGIATQLQDQHLGFGAALSESLSRSEFGDAIPLKECSGNQRQG